MAKCCKCEKKLGLFTETGECMDDDCNKVYCISCYELMKECDECRLRFCEEHFKDHSCNDESEDEEELGTTKKLIAKLKNLDESQKMSLIILQKHYDYNTDELLEVIELLKR